jgi:hypothetical protein
MKWTDGGRDTIVLNGRKTKRAVIHLPDRVGSFGVDHFAVLLATSERNVGAVLVIYCRAPVIAIIDRWIIRALLARILQYPEPLIFMGHIDKTPRVDQHILALRDQFALRKHAVTMRRIGLQEVSDLARRCRLCSCRKSSNLR